MVIIKNKWEEILVNSLLFSDVVGKDIIHMLNCSPEEESFGKENL